MDYAKVLVYEVFQIVDTGVVDLFIVPSKFLSLMFDLKLSAKSTFRFLLIIETQQNPNYRTISLLYLVKSCIAKKIVFNASVTTSLPKRHAAAIGTGLQ